MMVPSISIKKVSLSTPFLPQTIIKLFIVVRIMTLTLHPIISNAIKRNSITNDATIMHSGSIWQNHITPYRLALVPPKTALQEAIENENEKLDWLR